MTHLRASRRATFLAAVIVLTVSRAGRAEGGTPESEPLRVRADATLSGFFRYMAFDREWDRSRVLPDRPYKTHDEIRVGSLEPGMSVDVRYGPHELLLSYSGRSGFASVVGGEDARDASATARVIAYEYRAFELRPGWFLAARVNDEKFTDVHVIDHGYEATHAAGSLEHEEVGVLFLVDSEVAESEDVVLIHRGSLRGAMAGRSTSRHAPRTPRDIYHSWRFGMGLGWFQQQARLDVRASDRVSATIRDRSWRMETVTWTPMQYVRLGGSLHSASQTLRLDADLLMASLNGAPWDTESGRLSTQHGLAAEYCASITGGWSPVPALSIAMFGELTSHTLAGGDGNVSAVLNQMRISGVLRVTWRFELQP